jgi:hypothetical protein
MKSRLKKAANTVSESSLWKSVFDGCVFFLQETAKVLDPYWPGGMDYVKINVILFCIIMPIVFGLSLALNAYLLLRFF